MTLSADQARPSITDTREFRAPTGLSIVQRPLDAESVAFIRLVRRRKLAEFLREVPRELEAETRMFQDDNGNMHALTRIEVTNSIDSLRIRPKQIILIGIEPGRDITRTEVCTYFGDISMKTYERDRTKALDLLGDKLLGQATEEEATPDLARRELRDALRFVPRSEASTVITILGPDGEHSATREQITAAIDSFRARMKIIIQRAIEHREDRQDVADNLRISSKTLERDEIEGLESILERAFEIKFAKPQATRRQS